MLVGLILNLGPPMRSRARAAASPSTVRSTIRLVGAAETANADDGEALAVRHGGRGGAPEGSIAAAPGGVRPGPCLGELSLQPVLAGRRPVVGDRQFIDREQQHQHTSTSTPKAISSSPTTPTATAMTSPGRWAAGAAVRLGLLRAGEPASPTPVSTLPLRRRPVPVVRATGRTGCCASRPGQAWDPGAGGHHQPR